MSRTLRILILIIAVWSCKDQTQKGELKIVGGPCEDCAATMDYQLLKINPLSIDTLIGFDQINPKLKITGTVLKLDKKTPAENIILYVYHTNREGIYEPSDNPIGWEKRHGKYRGWLKTNEKGQFTFYTFRPAPYPKGQESEHIHIYIKESNKTPYYIDNFTFTDDPFLTKDKIQSQEKRGGSGIINLTEQNGILTGNRKIILGLNIPNYED